MVDVPSHDTSDGRDGAAGINKAHGGVAFSGHGVGSDGLTDFDYNFNKSSIIEAESNLSQSIA